jgi:hypothetical protein
MTDVTGAWSAALAAEQQAVFGYDVLGPHLARAATVDLARTCQAAHVLLRDAVIAVLGASGRSVPAPPVDYPDLYPVTSSASGELLALTLEQNTASAWRFAYATAAQSTGSAADQLRTSAQAALTDSAVRSTRWRVASGARAPTVAFPGI